MPYAIFGKKSTSRIDLAALGTRGYRMLGGAPYEGTGVSVAPAGDVNRDGIPDVILGAVGGKLHRRVCVRVGICGLRKG